MQKNIIYGFTIIIEYLVPSGTRTRHFVNILSWDGTEHSAILIAKRFNGLLKQVC